MKYICQICGYVFDEDVEKKTFADLPDDWKCPLCTAPKSAFEPQKETIEKPQVIKPVETNYTVTSNTQNLNNGQMAALCKNLSRACEKQYKATEAMLFENLASYYTERKEPVEDATLAMLLLQLQQDIEQYAKVREVADAHHDRGTARALVWGEKVTRMLTSLVSQYEKQGEALLKDQEVWVCSACGFVYLGKEAPELCPVCKVPAWKFEKVEGRKTV